VDSKTKNLACWRKNKKEEEEENPPVGCIFVRVSKTL